MMDLKHFEKEMQVKGWVIFPALFDKTFVARMLADMDKAYENCRRIQVKNGVDKETEGTLHHLVGQGDTFMEYIDKLEPLMPYMESYFQGKFILNSFGGNINAPRRKSYASNIHRDIRSFSGDMPLLLNTLFMLDDFTKDNGATWMLSGSHKKGEKPTEDYFWKNGEQAIGSAGSVLMFNSNVWHAAGENVTDKVRRSVTPMFCKPFMKQGFDYPRAVGYKEGEKLPEHVRQILGYNARVPATLDEWYQPPEKRMYRPGRLCAA
ncbi:MAG: phytanoyl-CoA dioxygenase [Proteobacteria bacterium]|nr:phytanoyl-CoA dioxygenase [Pseudomonadota bacterium]